MMLTKVDVRLGFGQVSSLNDRQRLVLNASHYLRCKFDAWRTLALWDQEIKRNLHSPGRYLPGSTFWVSSNGTLIRTKDTRRPTTKTIERFSCHGSLRRMRLHCVVWHNQTDRNTSGRDSGYPDRKIRPLSP